MVNLFIISLLSWRRAVPLAPALVLLLVLALHAAAAAAPGAPAALQPAMAWGLWRAQRKKAWFDCLALAAVLQFLAVLAAWGPIAFRLWA